MPLSTHLDARQIRAWIRKELPAGELLVLSGHLSGCAECKQKLEKLRTPFERSRLLRDFPAPLEFDHLTDDEIGEYVNGSLPSSARDGAGQHLKECATCLGQVEALVEFRDEMACDLPRHYEPPVRIGWQTRVADFLAALIRPAGRLVLSGAVAALLAVALIVKTLVPLHPTTSTSTAQTGDKPSDRAETTPGPIPEETPAKTETTAALAAPEPLKLATSAGGAANSPSHWLAPPGNPSQNPLGATQSAGESARLNAPLSPGLSLHLLPDEHHGDRIQAPSLTTHLRLAPANGATLAGAAPAINGGSSQRLYDGARLIVISGHGDLQGGLEGIVAPWIDWVRSALLTGIVDFPKSPLQQPQDIDGLRDPEAIAQVRSAEKNAALLPLKAGAHSHLVMGVVYAHYGLLPLAQKEFRSLADENPASPLAAHLLQQVTR